MRASDRIRRTGIRLFNWQYWPWPVVYTPLLVQYFYHSLRFPGAGFPALINRPFMELGGIFEESKLSVYHHIPKEWTPKTVALPLLHDRDSLIGFLDHHQLSLPLIVKPDRGMRGKGVRFHASIDSLLIHCRSLSTEHPHIVQPYINLPEEIGIFVIKGDEGWHITSLMQRELPQVVGNGSSSIEELIRQKDHLFLQLERIRVHTQVDLARVPQSLEKVVLDCIGNHRLGTRFIDRAELITPELKMAMQRICDLLNGFEYGRLDIRFQHWEGFTQLRDFSIIEVNGANSEPGHIYHDGFRLLAAWKVLLRHHKIIFHKAKKAQKNGQSAPNLLRSLALFRKYLRTMNLS